MGRQITSDPARSSLLIVCYLAFISLGLPDTLIGVAWPSVRRDFGLRQSDLSWIFVGSGCSYFVSSFSAGKLLRIWNVGMLLGLSSGLVALAAFDYSSARLWPLFAGGSLLHGLGSGAIDAGLNHYAASHFSARHMNWLHACYSVGAMLGPIVMTTTMAAWGSWRLGYVTVAVVLLVLASVFLATRGRWTEPQAEGEAVHKSAVGALRKGMVWFHIGLFFVYTGIEVAVGQWSYTILTEGRGIPPTVAGSWVTVYWASILAGRIVFGAAANRIAIDTLIRLSTLLAVAGTALFAWDPHRYAAPFALGLAGLGLAAIFPSLMTRTPQRLGKQLAAHAIGFQVGAAMLGAAILPSCLGFAAQRLSLATVPGLILAMATLLFALHEAVLMRQSAGSQRL